MPSPLRTILPLIFALLLCVLLEPVISPAGRSAASAAIVKKKPAKSNTKSSSTSRKTKGKTSTKSSRIQKGGKKSSSKKKYAPKRRRRSPAVAIAPRIKSIAADSSFIEDLSTGVTHQWLMTEGKHVANVIRIDLKSNARLRGFKAIDRYDGLERVRDLFERADSLIEDTVVAAANASFWKATYNSPIGLTIINGEVVEMPGYKAWSSLMLFDDGTAGIDRVHLRGELQWRHRRFEIGAINHRGSEPGIVAYNHYYGQEVPHGSRKSDSAIIAEVLANQVSADIGDDTEAPGIDTAALIRAYRDAKKLEDNEHSLLKVACRFLAPRRKRDPIPRPRIDDTMNLVVTEIDTGAVEMPEDGFIFSLGIEQENLAVIQVGDTLRLLYNVLPRQPKPIRDLFTGTPRIVRDGQAHPEHEIEGSKASRFVTGTLSRTAVGISRGNDTLFLVTINSPNPAEGTTGMTLSELARFMASIGSYQAMNFDGGGSTTMVIDGETISRQRGAPFNRKISTALLVVKEKATDKKKRPKAPSSGS